MASAMETARPPRTAADDAAFKRELVQLIPHLRAFARTLCGDPTAADDLAQDAMMKAWDARASFQMGTNMKAWTFMILRNQFYSEKRRSWRQSQLDQEAAERTLVAVDDPEAPVALDELRQGLAMLPAEQREALIRAIPFRRFAKPSEVADAILFFASERATYLTGQVLSVSGGVTMQG